MEPEGFGVLTGNDVQQTLRTKLNRPTAAAGGSAAAPT
jgi:hypothetical protein